MADIYSQILEIRKSKTKAVLCTIISASGSTPRKAGSKMLVTENMKIYGTIGGGVLENKVIDKAIEITNSFYPQVINFNLTKDLGMACGGTVEIFFEQVSNKYKLYIFGAGHVAKALVKQLEGIEFHISVIDDRENIFKDWDNSVQVISKILSPFDKFLIENSSDENTFIVIVTYEHSSDKEILKQYIKQNFAYLGMIGSKRKVEETKKLFISENYATADELEKVDMPIGLEIMAEGPDEIAISIAAKLILEKNMLMSQSNK